MVVGVARPHAKVSVRREEATVMLDVDVSRSMADVKPTRTGSASGPSPRRRAHVRAGVRQKLPKDLELDLACVVVVAAERDWCLAPEEAAPP
jgi:hypothetical protein